MGDRVWYVDSTRAPINWATAFTLAGGDLVAQHDIFRLLDLPGTANDRLTQWVKAGKRLDPRVVEKAKFGASTDPVPAPYAPPAQPPSDIDRLRTDIAEQSAALVPRQVGRVRSAVVADGTNQSAVLQAEIDEVSALGGGEILLPTGTVGIDTLVLRNGVSLIGSGKQATRLLALASAAPAAITLATGPVVNAWLRHLEVSGTTNTGQRGISFRSVGNGGTPNHGGWWTSGLDSVLVRNFDGDNIWLRGGGAAFLTPHQFLTFRDVESYAQAAGAALRLTGQVAQLTIIGGELDGPGQANDGTNVLITREVDDAGAAVSDVAPAAITFVNTTTQNNRRGLVVERAFPVTWLGGWMENLSEGIDASVSAMLVLVKGVLLTNVGANAGAGFAARSRNSAKVVVEHCVLSGSADKHFVSSGGDLVQRENIRTDGGTPVTEGMTPQFGIAGDGSLTLGQARTALVNGSATALTTIVSGAGTGETLSIKAHSGTITLGAGGNIHASGLTLPHVVPAGAILTLVKHDLASVWNVQSITG